ncbi:hypothetical protein pb186bvf_020417 [Paramecium bursaria]
MEFDFDKNEEWKLFEATMDPSISGERKQYLKELWYKQNVNKKHSLKVDKVGKVDFEFNFHDNLYHLENIFKGLFLLLCYMRDATVAFGFSFCLLALYRQVRNAQSNRWKTFKENEFLHNLFFIILFHNLEVLHNFIDFMPIILHAWIGMSEYLINNIPYIYKSDEKCD